MMNLLPEHPMQMLLFYLSPEVEDDTIDRSRSELERLATARVWTLAPPAFVDVKGEPEAYGIPTTTRTVGGLLALYSASVKWRGKLPPTVDRAHLDEVRSLVDTLAQVTARSACEVNFELDGVYVGRIRNGQPDHLLKEEFLGHWEATLLRREARNPR